MARCSPLAALLAVRIIVAINRKDSLSRRQIEQRVEDEGYVLSECCKLLTYSKEILFGKYKDAGTIFSIKAKIESRSLEVANQIDVFDELIDQETDGEKKKEMKIKVKVAKKSLKYLNRTAVELGKLVKSSDKELATQLLLPGQ